MQSFNWCFFKYIFLFFIFSCVTEAGSDDLCNPFIEANKTETTTAQLLAGLAAKYNFSLSFPKHLDQPVQVDDSMRLDRLIEMLTKGMNTVLRHEKVEGCTSMKLSELTVMPVGDETEFINVEKKPGTQPLEYIYIEDMEQYVTEVLMRERKPNVSNMTPEQAAEFRLVKKRLRVESESEIKQKKKEKKKNKKKIKQEKTNKNIGEDDPDA